jgi:hypothetical protein
MLVPVIAALFTANLSAGPAAIDPATRVRVDSSHHELVITTGPYNLPNMPPMTDHAMMDLGMSHDTPISRFQWPVEGWFRGFKIEVLDRDGHPLPRHIMHHMIMVNFSRRQLIYSAAERLMGAGTETDDAAIPRTIGVPMKANSDLGLYVAWHNDTGKDLDGVTLRLSLEWMPRNQNPRPLDVLPIYMDVNLTVGGTNTFDVPSGKSTKSFEFTLPVGGRLLAVGGHLHDYGVRVRLEDVESGRVLTTVNATRDAAGHVTKIDRKLFGVSGEGLRLRAGRRYRVISDYDNPTGTTIHNGAMAHMVGLFAPDDIRKWPQIDPSDETYQKDLASLRVRGHKTENMDNMEGMHHN